MDDPALIRAEIAELHRDIDATMAELRSRIDVRVRARSVAQRVRVPAARALAAAQTPTRGARSGGEDLAGRLSRALRELGGEPVAAVVLAAAAGVVVAILTTPFSR